MSNEIRDDGTEEGMLMETVIQHQGLEEGELYVLRRKRLEHIRRRDEEGLRRVRITEEAYEAVYELAQRMRPQLRGYRPDPFLVLSALVIQAAQQPDAETVVRQYLQALFTDGTVQEAATVR